MNHAATNARTEAERRGIAWATVLAVYGELREREMMRREWKWQIRDEFAWVTGFGGHLGKFKFAFRAAFNGGDMDQIPGFDVAAQTMAGYHPELAQDGDAAAALWAVICEPFDRMPAAERLYAEAIERAAGTCEDAERQIEEYLGDF